MLRPEVLPGGDRVGDVFVDESEQVVVTLFDMRYFCAHVGSCTGLADDPGPGSGAWIRSALPGGRRALRAVLRRRRAGLAVAVRARAAAGGGTAAAARSAGAPRRGPGGGSSRSVGTSWRRRGLRRGEVRRAAREELSLRAEVERLKRLLAAAGVDARKRSTIVSLRLEVETRRTRIGELEAELAKVRATKAVHAKARFGRKSERR